MDRQYIVSPSVVEADKESEIVISAFSGQFGFYDDITYKVQFVPKEEYDIENPKELKLLKIEENRITYKVKPIDGKIHIKYFFRGEQEWIIRISSDEYDKYVNPMAEVYRPNWDHLFGIPKTGIRLSVYSLCSDLFRRRPVRADLHLHTNMSDGNYPPEITAAYYRRAGYDTIAITDHHIYNTAKKAREKLDMKTSFEMLCAEEVHNGYVGYFHMVNIGSRYSVNDVYFNEKDRIKKEVEELKKSVAVPEGVDEYEYLNRVWLYREIKKAGGYAIYPHPYWVVGGAFHTQTSMSRAIMENGLCDAFEILGGVGTTENNNLQVMLYYDLLSKGCNIPIVGSTDCHDPTNPDTFCRSSTVAFADEKGLISAVSEGYSTALDSPKGEDIRVYGPFRLVKYVHFLLRNYYPIHNDICFAQGDMMLDYIEGDTGVKDMIEKQELRLKRFNRSFFGE